MNTDRAIKLLIAAIILFVAGWFAWERWGPVDGNGRLDFPVIPTRSEARVFCAISEQTGRCSCITAEGIRPEIPEDECRKRARESDTRR